MKLFHVGKDGGPESKVTGYWLVELKRLFSIALLRFGHGTRSAFHSHAFDSVSWVLRGQLTEVTLEGEVQTYRPSWRPIITRRSTFHRVHSCGTTWVLTLRGTWARTWQEYDPRTKKFSTLKDGRVAVSDGETVAEA